MMNKIDQHLEKLVYFHAIVEHDSLVQASKRLGLSQATISKSLKILEDVLEKQLMLRGKKGIKLTKEGKILKEFTDKLFVMSQTAFDKINQNEIEPQLRFGTHEIMINVITPILADFKTLSFKTVNESSFLIDDIIDDKLDLILVAAPKKEVVKGLVFEKICEDNLGFFATKEYFSKSILDLPHFNQFDFIFHPRTKARSNKFLSQELRAFNLSIKSKFEVSSLESVYVLAESGLGIGILPSLPLRALVKKSKLTKLNTSSDLQQFGSLKYFLIYKKSNDKIHHLKNAIKLCF